MPTPACLQLPPSPWAASWDGGSPRKTASEASEAGRGPSRPGGAMADRSHTARLPSEPPVTASTWRDGLPLLRAPCSCCWGCTGRAMRTCCMASTRARCQRSWAAAVKPPVPRSNLHKPACGQPDWPVHWSAAAQARQPMTPMRTPELQACIVPSFCRSALLRDTRSAVE